MLNLRVVLLTLLAARVLPAVSVAIASIPTSQPFTVNGSGCNGGAFTTPWTLDWTAGSTCTVVFTSPNATQAYVWNGWRDGVSTNPRTIAAPGQATTYTASFSPALPGPPGTYAVTQVAAYSPASSINNFGQVAGGNPGFLWTPLTAQGTVGTLVDLAGPDFGTVGGLNDRGQVAGTSPLPSNGAPHPLLWSPDAPNGTTGTVTSFLGATPGSATAINSFGQIAVGGFYLWTPSTPNGTTGTLNTDPRLVGITAINDFGQAVMQMLLMLFTPSVANGATGTFTSIPGLAGGVNHQLVAINKGGAVIGWSCMPVAGGACNPHGFIWTPASANGTTGATAEIPLPAGYTSLRPAALNAGGQAVGTLMTEAGAIAPFLYSAGTVYDLSALGSQLASGSPMAINDRGQIVIDAAAGAWLVTPGIVPPAPSPGAVAITIAAGSAGPAAGQAFTVSGVGCEPGGYATPQTLYWIPGSNCTVSFLSPHSLQVGTRYLFNAWQDGPVSNPRVIVAPAQAATYTGSFTEQFLVTAVSSPPEGGSVSGAGWFAAGSTATLTATPATGYRLSDWFPPLTPSGPSSLAVPVFAPQTITANFLLISSIPPNNYLTTQIAFTSAAGIGRPVNNFGQIVGGSAGSAFLWTPVAANSPAGSMTAVGGLPPGPPASSLAAGINDRGEIVGTTTAPNGSAAQAFLWSPDTPNGTSGTPAVFFGSAASASAGPTTVFDINSYGQVAGIQNGSPFLWTPSSPNGTTGTMTLDARFAGLTRINDFGQAIMTSPPMLFTPSAVHGVAGSFTAVPGLPGEVSHQLIAMNNNGAIVGVSCLPQASAGLCSFHAFLWTPTAPNGTTGADAEIPLPSGFVSITPFALNAGGQVAGVMTRVDGVTIPFLYSAGSVYDLSALNAQLRGGSPVGINDRGQIVINGSGAVYLLTPGAAPPSPPPGSVAVTLGAGAPIQPFTVTGAGCSVGAYTSPQTLYWIPGASCTVTFVSPQTNTLGIREVFAGWQDGVSTNPRVFIAPAQAAAYSASFSTQLFLGAVASPAAGGTVSGGGWYAYGSAVTLTAAAAPGYRVLDWTPSSLAAPGATSATVTVNGPQTAVANFVLIAALPPSTYQVTQITGLSGSPAIKPINSFGQIVGSIGPTSFLWTPVAANSPSGSQVSGLSGGGPFEVAAAINDQGQVVGANTQLGSAGRPFLWTPNTPNATTGTATAFLDSSIADALSGTLDINNFGQISGQLSASSFLWTPSSANGTTGTINSDSRFNLVRGINDFGQAIMNTTPLTPSLFTPSAAHGNTGTFTPVFGLAGAVGSQLQDINARGAIAGSSCIPTGINSPCANHLFLWTPTSPNAATGVATEIPLPAGIVSAAPMALNAVGNIVGNITLAGGLTVPFLSNGGTIYDLSTLSSQLQGGTATGINDSGQIVVNAGSALYLLTPQPSQPAAVFVLPASGSAPSQTFTFTFSDPRGWQDLDVVNILIGNFLDGRNACYLAYSRPLNVLYLVNDAGTALLPGMVLNGTVGVSNGQCALTVSGSPAGSGNTLALTMTLAFSSSFAGNKVIYLAARDISQNNSGWQALGTWGVPGGAAGQTAAVSANPASGSGPGGTFTFTFTDTKGWQDFGVLNILINNFLDGRNACYLAYSRPSNVLYLVNDAGTALSSGLVLGASGSVGNGQCTVNSAGSSVTGSGNTLQIVLNIGFQAPFAGNRVIYLAARDTGDLNNSGWQALGSWTVFPNFAAAAGLGGYPVPPAPNSRDATPR